MPAPQLEMFDKPRQFTRLTGDGYAASPGSGPAGETCKTCAHCRRHRLIRKSGVSGWNKCAMVRKSFGPGSDIRLDAPACVHWTKADDASTDPTLKP